MDTSQLAEQSQFIYNNLRLKTFPVGIKFLKKKMLSPKKPVGLQYFSRRKSPPARQ